jgi:hypothetical protein
MKIVSRAQSASTNMQWSYLRLDIWRQQRRSITVVLVAISASAVPPDSQHIANFPSPCCRIATTQIAPAMLG